MIIYNVCTECEKCEEIEYREMVVKHNVGRARCPSCKKLMKRVPKESVPILQELCNEGYRVSRITIGDASCEYVDNVYISCLDHQYIAFKWVPYEMYINQPYFNIVSDELIERFRDKKSVKALADILRLANKGEKAILDLKNLLKLHFGWRIIIDYTVLKSKDGDHPLAIGPNISICASVYNENRIWDVWEDEAKVRAFLFHNLLRVLNENKIDEYFEISGSFGGTEQRLIWNEPFHVTLTK